MRDAGEVFVSELYVRDGSRLSRWVRWELFVFRDVRDVLATADKDVVLIVHDGPGQPDRWRQALSDAGFDTTSPASRLAPVSGPHVPVSTPPSEPDAFPVARPFHVADGGGLPVCPPGMSPWRSSAARCRAVGVAIALSGIAVALTFRSHAPIVALVFVIATSVLWIGVCMQQRARRDPRRAAPASGGLIASGPGAPILRFHDDRPRVLCAGWLQPKVFISTGALFELPNDQLRAAVNHQQVHARRRDPLRLLIAHALADGLPFLPALHSLVSRYQRRLEASVVHATAADGPEAICPLRPAARPTNGAARTAAGRTASGAATLITLAGLTLHATGLLDPSSVEVSTPGGQLCVVAVVATSILGAATALRGDVRTA